MKTFLVRLTQTFNNPLAPSLFQCNFSHNSFLFSKGKDSCRALEYSQLMLLSRTEEHCNDE